MLILLRLVYVRVRAVKKNEVSAAQLSSGEKLPSTLVLTSNNFNNLFQLPLLFLVFILFLQMSEVENSLYICLSWGFVLSRIFHSIFHLTNKLIWRLISFALGAVLLFWMYTSLLMDLNH
jgi:hypothetical protein